VCGGVGRRDRENSLLSSWGCWYFVFWCVGRGNVRAGRELDSPVLSKGEQGYLHDLDHCATVKRLPQFHFYLSRPGSEIKLHCLQSRVRLTPDLLFLYFGTSLWRYMPSIECHDSRQTMYICCKVFFIVGFRFGSQWALVKIVLSGVSTPFRDYSCTKVTGVVLCTLRSIECICNYLTSQEEKRICFLRREAF
jgi:hypothetical protein